MDARRSAGRKALTARAPRGVRGLRSDARRAIDANDGVRIEDGEEALAAAGARGS